MTPEDLFLSQLPNIEGIIASICNRRRLFGADAEDFASQVKLKLIDDDYAVLRKFAGRSRLDTYLTTVIVNLYRDFRIQRWGKWRPSAAAQRSGQVAIELEELLHRDGRDFDEAVSILRLNRRVEMSRQDIAKLAETLPVRTRYRETGEEGLEEVTDGPLPEDQMIDRQRQERRSEAETLLRQALDGLDPEDRLILELRYWGRHQVSQIARILSLPPKPLYRRLYKLYEGLREVLRTNGFDTAELKEVFDD